MAKKTKNTEERVVEVEKTYTVKTTMHTDGSVHMHRINNGYNPLELLGILHFSALDIQKQMRGEIEPDVIKRSVVKG